MRGRCQQLPPAHVKYSWFMLAEPVSWWFKGLIMAESDWPVKFQCALSIWKYLGAKDLPSFETAAPRDNFGRVCSDLLNAPFPFCDHCPGCFFFPPGE